MTAECIVLECLLGWWQDQRRDVIQKISWLEPSFHSIQEERSRIDDMKKSLNPDVRDLAFNQEKSIEEYHWKLCSELFELEELKRHIECSMDFLYDVKYFK